MLPYLNDIQVIKFETIRHSYEDEDDEEDDDEEDDDEEDDDDEDDEDDDEDFDSDDDRFVDDDRYDGLNHGQNCGVLSKWNPNNRIGGQNYGRPSGSW